MMKRDYSSHFQKTVGYPKNMCSLLSVPPNLGFISPVGGGYGYTPEVLYNSYLHSMLPSTSGMMSPAEIQQLWKEVAAQSGLEETPKNGLTIPTIPSVTSAPSVTVPPQTTVIQAPSYMTNGGIPVDGFLLPGKDSY